MGRGRDGTGGGEDFERDGNICAVGDWVHLDRDGVGLCDLDGLGDARFASGAVGVSW